MRRAILATCVALAVGGCSRGDPPVGTTTLTKAEFPSSSVSFLEADPILTRRVEAAIAADPFLSINAKNVEVTVENGVATLNGSVVDKEYRRDLERVVARVPGITDTRNAVEVAMARDYNDRESDEKIAFSLQRAFASLPSVGDDADRVAIDVVHGRVALRGATKFETTRQQVERIAEETPGVVAVTNELVVR